MKIQKCIKNIVKIIIILILVSFLGQYVYAENETGEETGSGNNSSENTETTNQNNNEQTTPSEGGEGESSNPSSGSPSSNSGGNSSGNSNGSSSGNSNSKQTTSKKSSDATLSNLGIRPNDFSGFKPGTLNYNVTVPADVEEVEVYATATNSKATISGTGTKKLQDGENALSVVVTAEDGTQRTYTINVTRTAGENTENVPEEVKGQGLATLTIENLELSPNFDTNTYAYTVKYIGEAEKLNIQTTTTDPYYNVEIAGNEGLVEGENIITILVTDPDDNNIATYQITVNKSLVDEEALAREQEELEKQQQRKMIIAGAVAGVIVVIVAIILIVRHRRNKAWAEEYTVPYSGLNDEEDYNDEYNYDDNYNMNFNNGNIEFDDSDEIEEVEPLEEVENNDFANKNLEDEQEKTPEELEKERIRQQFLSNYENEGFDLEEEKSNYEPRKRRHKGKRFK